MMNLLNVKRSNVTRVLAVGFFFGLLLGIFATDCVGQNTSVKVYIFAGQSNALGGGSRARDFEPDDSDELSPYAYKLIKRIRALDPAKANDPRIRSNWRRSDDLFHTLNTPRANNWISGNVSAENNFARIMRKFHKDTHDIAIVKVAAGSSKMIDWEPPSRLWLGEPDEKAVREFHSPCLFFRHLLPTVDAKVSSLESTYTDVEVAGFVWIQGESDLSHFRNTGSPAVKPPLEKSYTDWRQPFERMVAVLRWKHDVPEMPFVICRTKGYRGDDFEIEGKAPEEISRRANRLQQLQTQIAKDDLYGKWVNTQHATTVYDLKDEDNPDDDYDDPVHWDMDSLNFIGFQIANCFKAFEGED